jgi:hypothetical protein
MAAKVRPVRGRTAGISGRRGTPFERRAILIYLHIGMLYERVFPYNADMKLWLLRPRADILARAEHPWKPPYDKTFGVVVRAETEAEARRLAQTQAGFEGQGVYRLFGADEDESASDVWLDHAWTTCEEAGSDGESGVILVDRR